MCVCVGKVAPGYFRPLLTRQGWVGSASNSARNEHEFTQKTKIVNFVIKVKLVL